MTLEREGLHVIAEEMSVAVDELYEEEMGFILQVFPLKKGDHKLDVINNVGRSEVLRILRGSILEIENDRIGEPAHGSLGSTKLGE